VNNLDCLPDYLLKVVILPGMAVPEEKLREGTLILRMTLGFGASWTLQSFADLCLIHTLRNDSLT
jgi:hypothetical protein